MSTYKIGEGIFWKPGRRGYMPDVSLGNDSPDFAYAGENVVFEGVDLVKAARNPLDIELDAAAVTLGYNIALTAGSTSATCSGGTLLTDCVPYQHISANGILYTITEILSNTAMTVDPAPTANFTGSLVLVPNLHSINNGRASLLAGNVVEYLQCLWVVGRGVLKVNGAAISDSLTATSTPQVAYAETSTTYDVRNVGFTRPDAPTIVSVSGGTKSMPAGYIRGIRVSKKRVGELGYGPASEPVLVDMSSGVGNKARITFDSYDTNEGQNRWLVWVTKDEVSLSIPQAGPWFEYGEVEGDGIDVDIEWRSGELGGKYVEDYARAPEKAVCVAASGDILMWGGALGADPSGIAGIPGDTVLVSNPFNPEGYPAAAYAGTSNGEEIISLKAGKVHLYLFTHDSIQYASLTQATQEPLTILPFAQSGVRHQYNACIGADVLMVFTDGKLVNFNDRTLQENSVLYEMQMRVASLLRDLPASRVFLGYDPSLNQFVLFCSNYRQGSGSGWQTMALSFDMRDGRVNPPQFLGDGTTNFTVTGCATVNNHLEFITSDGVIWRWQQGTGSVTGYLASPFSAWGSNMTRSTIRRVAMTGYLDGQVAIISNLDKTTLTASSTPGSGTVPSQGLTTDGNWTEYPVWQPNVQGKTHAVRVDFDSEGGQELFDLVEVGAVKHIGVTN